MHRIDAVIMTFEWDYKGGFCLVKMSKQCDLIGKDPTSIEVGSIDVGSIVLSKFFSSLEAR